MCVCVCVCVCMCVCVCVSVCLCQIWLCKKARQVFQFDQYIQSWNTEAVTVYSVNDHTFTIWMQAHICTLSHTCSQTHTHKGMWPVLSWGLVTAAGWWLHTKHSGLFDLTCGGDWFWNASLCSLDQFWQPDSQIWETVCVCVHWCTLGSNWSALLMCILSLTHSFFLYLFLFLLMDVLCIFCCLIQRLVWLQPAVKPAEQACLSERWQEAQAVDWYSVMLRAC